VLCRQTSTTSKTDLHRWTSDDTMVSAGRGRRATEIGFPRCALSDPKEMADAYFPPKILA
jgi:hypothetical protein